MPPRMDLDVYGCAVREGHYYRMKCADDVPLSHREILRSLRRQYGEGAYLLVVRFFPFVHGQGGTADVVSDANGHTGRLSTYWLNWTCYEKR
jgi:hypothetical protein